MPMPPCTTRHNEPLTPYMSAYLLRDYCERKQHNPIIPTPAHSTPCRSPRILHITKTMLPNNLLALTYPSCLAWQNAYIPYLTVYVPFAAARRTHPSIHRRQTDITGYSVFKIKFQACPIPTSSTSSRRTVYQGILCLLPRKQHRPSLRPLHEGPQRHKRPPIYEQNQSGRIRLRLSTVL